MNKTLNCKLSLCNSSNPDIPQIHFNSDSPFISNISATFLIDESFNEYTRKPFISTESIFHPTIECECPVIPFNITEFSSSVIVSKWKSSPAYLHFDNFVIRGDLSLSFLVDVPVYFSNTHFMGRSSSISIYNSLVPVYLEDAYIESSISLLYGVIVLNSLTIKNTDFYLTSSDLSDAFLYIQNCYNTTITILPAKVSVVPPKSIFISNGDENQTKDNYPLIYFYKTVLKTNWLNILYPEDTKQNIETEVVNGTVISISFVETNKHKISQKLIITISVCSFVLCLILCFIIYFFCSKKHNYQDDESSSKYKPISEQSIPI